MSPEGRANIRASLLRRYADPAARAKIAEAKRRHWADPDTRARNAAAISATNKGVPRPPEVRARIAEGQVRRWQDPEKREKAIAGCFKSWSTGGRAKDRRPRKESFAMIDEKALDAAVRAELRRSGDVADMARHFLATYGHFADIEDSQIVKDIRRAYRSARHAIPRPVKKSTRQAAALAELESLATKTPPPAQYRQPVLAPPVSCAQILDLDALRAIAKNYGVAFRGSVDMWALNKAAEKRGEGPFTLRAPASASKKPSSVDQVYKQLGLY